MPAGKDSDVRYFKELVSFGFNCSAISLERGTVEVVPALGCNSVSIIVHVGWDDEQCWIDHYCMGQFFIHYLDDPQPETAYDYPRDSENVKEPLLPSPSAGSDDHPLSLRKYPIPIVNSYEYHHPNHSSYSVAATAATAPEDVHPYDDVLYAEEPSSLSPERTLSFSIDRNHHLSRHAIEVPLVVKTVVTGTATTTTPRSGGSPPPLAPSLSSSPEPRQSRPRSRSKPADIFIHPTNSNLARADALAQQLGLSGDTELVKAGQLSTIEAIAWEAGKGKDRARELLQADSRKNTV